jgi:HEAT repeat protein
MSDTILDLIKDLSNPNGIKRQKARYAIVKIGNPALDYLLELQKSEKHITRWESIKAISEIGSSDSIPILINALEDEEFDVRWLAAEGLIEIGITSVRPLLKEFISNKDSIHLKEGVHHVLKGLDIRGLYDDKYGIIKALELFTQPVKLELKIINMLKDEPVSVRS